MNNIIEKDKIYILERELTKATTDFYIAETLFDKSFVEPLKRYSQFLKDISNHYAYTGISCLYKIFDKDRKTNNIDNVIKHLTDISKKDNFCIEANKIREKLNPILERRSELVAHSSQEKDKDYLVFYKTYSIQEYNDIIKPTLDSIADMLNRLRAEFGFESDFDHHLSGIESESKYLIESLIEIEKQRGYV